MLDLLVNGKDHSGWLSMMVARSMQELVGSFTLDFTNPKVRGDSPLIKAGNLCKVSIRNQESDPKFQVIEGFVDVMSGGGDSNGVVFESTGRDRTGDLVDSAVTRLAEWKDLKFEDFVADLVSDFNINVAIAGGLDTGAAIPRINYDQGTTYSELIAEYAQQKQVLIYTLPSGELFITRASKTLGAISLIDGENILEHSINMDWSNIFSEYIVKGSRQSQDNEPEEDVTQVEACAIDTRFPRTNRRTIITPDTEQTTASAQQIADWHASTRMGNAEAYTVLRNGWFPVLNELAYVKIPSYGLDANMLIEGYELTADESGKKTLFNVVHPRAFDLLPGNEIKKDSKDSELLDTQ